MSSSKLLDRTLHLVRNRPVTETYQTIAAAAKVSPHWVKTLASGKIPDPGVCKVEAVFNYLNKQPLDLGDI